MTFKRLAPAAAAALLALPASALAQAPPNDNYLQSLAINGPNTQIPEGALRDTQDTTLATEQPDIFNPRNDGSPGGGGPPENLTCQPQGGQASTYGKTVWYDVYPPLDGIVRVQTVASFDPVISVIPFNTTSAVPDFNSKQCIDTDPGPTEELFAAVSRGRAYTIQIGGFQGGGGPLQTTFEFLPDRDGDGALDATDRCPTRAGDVNGCPRRLDRTVRAPFRWNGTAGGVRLSFLKVEAPRGSRVRVTCTRGGCRPISRRTTATITEPIGQLALASDRKGRGRPLAGATRRAEPRAYAARTIKVISNKRMSAGTRIDVRVTQPTAVGALIRHTVGNGSFKQTRFCLPPGSSKPRKRCR